MVDIFAVSVVFAMALSEYNYCTGFRLLARQRQEGLALAAILYRGGISFAGQVRNKTECVINQ
ncbi:MAG: hypothetical protein HQ513_01135 [Rhodospirillales bacterium]|nr:hypothetical protein [Rhodospirillales bacterium]